MVRVFCEQLFIMFQGFLYRSAFPADPLLHGPGSRGTWDEFKDRCGDTVFIVGSIQPVGGLPVLLDRFPFLKKDLQKSFCIQ